MTMPAHQQGMVGHYNRVDAPKIPQYHELMWPADRENPWLDAGMV
jgi:hypothetical protein